MAENKEKTTSEFLSYKGFPLVRKGNEIYYGNMSDEYVVMMQIVKTEKQGDLEVASKVKVFRMLTDDTLPAEKRIVKTVEKDSLYDALDIASVWLARTAG